MISKDGCQIAEKDIKGYIFSTKSFSGKAGLWRKKEKTRQQEWNSDARRKKKNIFRARQN